MTILEARPAEPNSRRSSQLLRRAVETTICSNFAAVVGGRPWPPAPPLKDLNVKRSLTRSCVLVLTCFAACQSYPRSDKSFDQIRAMVQGKTATEVEKLLGPPDSRQPLLLGDERWIWWNYTFLGGQDYSPEVRGKIVHLQITFANPDLSGKDRPPYSRWRIEDPESVSFVLPGSGP